MRQRSLKLICVALVMAGIAALIAGGLPYERMQAYGALVRRANDFTPERFARYRHVCWFFAAASPALAFVLWRRTSSFGKTSEPALAVSPAPVPRTDSAWLVGLIVAIGFGLRFQRLFDPVAYDEAYTYLNFASRPWYEAIGDYNSTNNHLLNTLLMHVSTRIFGPQEWAMRWHVVLAGSVLPIAVYVWGRDWFGRPVGLIAMAAVAVSPMLITYSADARGYMLVALAAIVFDWSLARLAGMRAVDAGTAVESEASFSPLPGPPPAGRGEGEGFVSGSRGESGQVIDRRAWWMAWGALVFGLCSMPLMVYAAVGSSAWFVTTPLVRLGLRASLSRIGTLATLGGLALPVVAAFYAPSYIFRGLMFLNDPIMQSADVAGFVSSLTAAWRDAFDWWTAGIAPRWLWGSFALIGIAVMPSNAVRLRWGLPFVVVLLLNVAQQVAPPPRIYMHLAPWLFVSAALGLMNLLQVVRSTALHRGTAAALLLLAAGGIAAATRPVLFNVNERANFVSVPEAIEAVQLAVDQHRGEKCVLLAPLPCDLPSIFYMRRSGNELPVNVRPEPGARVYLFVRSVETPEQVLATPLLNMSDLAAKFEPWIKVATFETLTLYTSRIPVTVE